MRSEHFKLLVASEFPFPIAVAFRQASEDRESGHELCALLEATAQYVAQVLASDYFAQEDRDPALDRDLASVIAEKTAPSPGAWQNVSFAILRYFADRARLPLVAELRVLLESSVQRDYRQLVTWRNRWVHPPNAALDVPRFRRLLLGILERIILIHRYSLFCPKTDRLSGSMHVMGATLLAGDNPILGEVECRSEAPLEAGKVFIYSRETRELLSLYPLIQCGPCPECGESRYFSFSKSEGRKLLYAAIPCGHMKKDAEAAAALDHMLRRPQTRRLRPRHFSIPGAFGSLPRTLKPGDHVGPYQIDELIKIGGMGQVYRAMDTRTGKAYALKLLPLEFSRDPGLLERFEEEAHNMKGLSHPNVVSLYDLGEDCGDRYLVMDLILGGVVGSQRCRDLSEARKPLREEDVIAAGRQICEGLNYIHSRGIIHRDLKPGNIMVSGERLVITDFGISRSRGEPPITMPGMPVGTPEYMAPEQIREEEVDQRTDIYALGCMLYELASGRTPYRADTPLTTALYHLQARPPRLEELNARISPGLANIISKAMHKRPHLRYQTARELFDDLARAAHDPAGPQFLEGEVIPQDILEEARMRTRRYRRRFIAAVALLVVAVVLLLMSLGVRSLYRDWRVARLVGDARRSWQAEPARWDDCCATLRRALLEGRYHRAVEGFLAEIRATGRLTVDAGAAASEVSVVPDNAPFVGGDFGFAPKVLAAGNRFRSREPIPVAPGRYRVAIERGGRAVSVPAFVGIVVYRRAADERWERTSAVPATAGTLEPTTESIPFADHATLDLTDMPEAIAEGLRYVPGGLFFRSERPDLGEAEKMQSVPRPTKGDVLGVRDDHLVPDVLPSGFLVGADEVTVGEFERWFDRFGRDCCLWFHEQGVRKDLSLLGDDLPVEAVRGKIELVHDSFKKMWSKHAGDVSGWLKETKDKELPVTKVMWPVAKAYSRTHAPVRAGELRPWLEDELGHSEALRAALLRLGEDLAREPGDLVPLSRLPDRETLPILWRGDHLTEFKRWTLGEAYVSWMRMGWEKNMRRARDVPVARLIEVARRRTPGRADLETIREELARNPELPLRGEPAYEGLFRDWLGAVETGEEPLEKASVGRWLKHVAAEDAARAQLLSDARSRVEGLAPDDEVQELPWELRLEYGWSRGWDLPASREWEKACRGPDGRPFPWGTDAEPVHAWLGPGRQGPRKVSEIGRGFDLDTSPYGVRGLAGNVSEWLDDAGFGVDGVLKGGNFACPGFCAHASHWLAIDGGACETWIGIRVVRQLVPR